MKKGKIIGTLFISILYLSCSNSSKELIDEDKLGLIDADVKSTETNFKTKAEYSTTMPGASVRIERAFENAPPMIPHTTDGFFPITPKNNICLSCHMPDKVAVSGAVALPKTHFTFLRHKMEMKDGKYTMPVTDPNTKPTEQFNRAYFNCSQCHTPQATVTVNIENLFTPEFRSATGLKQSNLTDKLNEGIKLK